MIAITIATALIIAYMQQRELHTLACRLCGYTVQGRGFDKKHYALTRVEAFEWLGCYDDAVVTRRGKFYASIKVTKA
jgi:hypothetical protein